MKPPLRTQRSGLVEAVCPSCDHVYRFASGWGTVKVDCGYCGTQLAGPPTLTVLQGGKR